MKKINNKLGFTLIELLVVITIIGILATGAVNIFTTQLQGARDSTRIGDLKIMETGLHSYFSDESIYPIATAMTGSISQFISKKLVDPKKGKTICWATATTNTQTCEGYYGVYDDSFNLDKAAFKLGISFEKLTNFSKKALNTGIGGDGGNQNSLYEIYAGAGANSGALVPGTATSVY